MTERQLAFDLGQRPALGREDFLVAPCNRDAVAWLDRWPHWPAPALVLWGAAGCGKSHLAQVWQARSGAAATSVVTLGTGDLSALATGALVLEDADARLDLLDEAALFHLYNLMAEAGRHVLLTARTPPSRWPLKLPDLASRLRAAPAVVVQPPDEALIGGLLVKLFVDRQLRVGQEVIGFLLSRMERSFAAARSLVLAVDAAALAERRNITVPLVRGVLQRQEAAAMEAERRSAQQRQEQQQLDMKEKTPWTLV